MGEHRKHPLQADARKYVYLAQLDLYKVAYRLHKCPHKFVLTPTGGSVITNPATGTKPFEAVNNNTSKAIIEIDETQLKPLKSVINLFIKSATTNSFKDLSKKNRLIEITNIK